MPDMTGVPSYGPCGDSNLAMKAIIQGGKNAVLGTPFGHEVARPCDQSGDRQLGLSKMSTDIHG